MLYRDYEANEWKLMPLVATYLQHEKEHEQHITNEEEILPYEEMGHIDNLEIKEAKYEQDVIERLDEVKGYPEEELNTVQEYVLNNNVVDGTSLSIKKQNELMEASILELTMMMGGF